MYRTNETKYKRILHLLSTIMLVCMLLALACQIVMAATPQEYRSKLWAVGGITTASNSDMLTAAAFRRYIEANAFGQRCRASVGTLGPDATLDDIFQADGCSNVSTFYDNAQIYGQYVEDRMYLYDQDGSRFDRAMTKLSSFASKIFSVIIAFGLITSFLCFTVIFMTIVWMPDSPIMRRKAMIDIITSGVSVLLLGNAWIVISLFQATFQRFWQTYAVYSKDWLTVANLVLSEYKWFVTGICGIGTLVALGMFMVNFASLALAGSNASKRSEKMKDILYCAIATAGLGSVTTITAFFWSALG